MVSQLIECLVAYKSKKEYQNKDSDAERAVQYKETRRKMGKLDYDVFGTLCLLYRDKTKHRRKNRSFGKYILKKKMIIFGKII